MKRLIFSLFLSLLFYTLSQAQVPVYDQAKHYQLRSMEDGPWEFHPPGWYYSWWSKDMKVLWWKWKQKLPGLGLHDNGPAGIGVGGDHYVTRYAPNLRQRVAMLAAVKKTREEYEKVTKSIQEVHKRELLNVADRSVDIVKGDIDPVFTKLNLIFAKKMVDYAQLIGRNETYAALLLEQQKIKDAIDYMHKQYVRNADRQKAYNSQLKRMEELIVKLNRILKREYAFQRLKSLS